MKSTNEKLIRWEKSDFARVISYFAIHTAIIMFLFLFALALSANFDMSLMWQHLLGNGVLGTVFISQYRYASYRAACFCTSGSKTEIFCTTAKT